MNPPKSVIPTSQSGSRGTAARGTLPSTVQPAAIVAPTATLSQVGSSANISAIAANTTSFVPTHHLRAGDAWGSVRTTLARFAVDFRLDGGGAGVTGCPSTVPSSTTIVLSTSSSSSPTSCEITTSVVPDAFTRCSAATIAARDGASRPASGSSRTSSRGLQASSPARATRRC